MSDKQMWIEALRSGDYEQGKAQLKNRGRYCCLGVLAEELGILDEEGYMVESGSHHYLPTSVLELEKQWPLSAMNDIEGKTFEEIADYLERTLPDDWKPNVL